MPRPPAPDGGPPPRVGKGWQAWFQGDWHGVEVLEVRKDTVQVHWEYDDSESEIWHHYVRPAPGQLQGQPEKPRPPQSLEQPRPQQPEPQPRQQQQSQPQPPPQQPRQPQQPHPGAGTADLPGPGPALPGAAGPQLVAGSAVEGLYSDSWFDAMVVRSCDRSGTVRVRWDYDGTEAALPVRDVRAKEPPPPKEEAPPAVAAAAPPPVKAGPPAPPRATQYQAEDRFAREPADAVPPGGQKVPSSVGAWPGSLPAKGAPERQAGCAMAARDVRRLLELIPKDAPREVRAYLESLLPLAL